ncbi:hypothetical protein HOF56_04085 [Candidatus Peribacteria bacterium]|jgi:hypothetical protein|nr:hypothetical protein [Candidatus Peribacteria bacterium]MBT4021520.1 hypothetical protein [Candidatus Peribacteria bacterium]MBT4240998.1 hypothetical protein [Candidatus Peribacteria bacterium]MBT4473991.1 hypothetical protein [Candidatus Peribacteria bacterium]
MEIDPHTIQQILTKVREQLKCPQCRKKVDVTMESLKVVGDGFSVMQLKCEVCDAHIMLYANMASGTLSFSPPYEDHKVGQNASSSMAIHDVDVNQIKDSISKSGGSFMNLFEENS